MRFLRILGFHLIFARRVGHVVRAIFLADDLSGRRDGLGRHVDAVGTHVSNEADGLAVDVDAFVETLGDLHGAGGREPQLARGLLLQRRGGEGRGRIAAGRLGLDRAHRERRRLECFLEGFGFGARADVEAVDLAAVRANKARDEGRAGLGLEMGDQRPVFAGDESLDLEFTVADEAQRDGLDAASRAGARQLAPQDRGQVEADEVVERAAGEIGLDQRRVDLARVLHRVEDRVLGDGVEDDTLDLLVLEDFLVPQDFEYVPGDGLAFAVRVGRQNDLVGALHGAGDVGETLGRLAVDLPFHGEIGVRFDRTVLCGQIAHMAERGENLVAAAEIFVDRLGLGRRFDDDDVHEIQVLARLSAGLKTLRRGLPAGAGRWSRGSGLSNPGSRAIAGINFTTCQSPYETMGRSSHPKGP